MKRTRRQKELTIMDGAHEVASALNGEPPGEMVGFLLHELLCEECGGPHAAVSYIFRGVWNGGMVTMQVIAALGTDDTPNPAGPLQ